MLSKLYIKNYAIIESVTIQFSQGLNIITGETGSGKSILLGALGLILGKRADTRVLWNKEQKCIVEGWFDIRSFNLENYFQNEKLEYDSELIIRREINPSGKSRAFINDSPVSLVQLRQLAIQLVDLHQQFENLGINDPIYQIQMVDALADNLIEVASYKSCYQKWKKLGNQLSLLKSKQAESIKQRDYLMFQIEEIEHAKLEAKDETLEEDLKAMEHSEEIIKKLGGLAYQLDESEDAVIHSLNKMAQEIQHLTNYQKQIDEIYQRLHASIVDLEDIAGEMKQISERTNYDQQSIQEMRERVDLINQLCFKHQVNSVVSLMEFYNELQKKAKDFENIETEIDKLEDTLKLQEQKLTEHSNQLTSKRKQVIPDFEKNVESLLKDLKMQHAAFKIQMVSIDQFGPMGKEQISFLFAPNKGSQFHPIKEVASGGELSRLALITKSLVASSLKLPH